MKTALEHKSTDGNASTPKPSLLVLIDDDRSMAAMLSDYLTGEGFAIKHAETGAAGLQLACETGTALVLLDVVLSDENGFDVLRALRKTSRVPVIMLTMQGAVADRVKGLELGADDYIPKPFTPIEVLARIKSLLRRNQYAPRKQSSLTVDDLALLAASRTVLQSGSAVQCTTAEFDVLYSLAASPGVVVTKEDLTRSSLGRTSYSGDRGVDNLVHSLRKKLGPRVDGEERFKSIRNIGYVYLRSAPGIQHGVTE